MDYFSYALIEYAKNQIPAITIDWEQYKSKDSTIAMEELDSSYWQSSPWRETYVLGFMLRDKDFNTLNGDGGIVDQVDTFLKNLPGVSVSSNFDVIGITEPKVDINTFKENYFHHYFRVDIYVKNKKKL